MWQWKKRGEGDEMRWGGAMEEERRWGGVVGWGGAMEEERRCVCLAMKEEWRGEERGMRWGGVVGWGGAGVK